MLEAQAQSPQGQVPVPASVMMDDSSQQGEDPQQAATAKIQQVQKAAQPKPGQAPQPNQMVNPQVAQNSTGDPGTAQAVATSNQKVPASDPNSVPSMLQGITDQEQGLHVSAEAISDQYKATSARLQQAADQDAMIKNHFIDNVNDINNERTKVLQDYRNGIIDPNNKNYWDNHSKVLSTIGLIVGGFTPNGQPNLAYNMLRSQMEDNLRVQQQNQDTRNNMFGALQHMYGDARDAADMHRLINADMTKHDIDKIAAQYGSPQALAQAQMAKGKIETEYSQPIMLNMAMRKAMIPRRWRQCICTTFCQRKSYCTARS